MSFHQPNNVNPTQFDESQQQEHNQVDVHKKKKEVIKDYDT